MSVLSKFKPKYIYILLAILILLLPTYMNDPYIMRVVQMIAIFALLGLGLNFLFGYTGQISIGHSAFYGMGAYVSAILETRFEMFFLLAWVIAIAFTAIVAYLLSFPILKLKGHYLAMATLALVLIVETSLGHGITVITSMVVGQWFVDYLYYFIIGSTLIAIWVLNNIAKSSVGRAHQALRDDEDAAKSLGVPVKKYKVNAFVFSAVLAAIAGIWYVHLAMVITPEVFGLHVSIQLLMMVVLGGMGSNLGAILGAMFIIMLPEFLSDFQGSSEFIYGVIVLVVLLFMPKGLAGIVDKIKSLFMRKKQPESKESEAIKNAS